MRERALLLGSPQSGAAWGSRRMNFRWGQNEHALRGKGAIARKQKESRSFKRLSCSLARIATRERTKSYVTALRNGALTKQIANLPHEKNQRFFPRGPRAASDLSEGNIRMKNKEKAPFPRGAYSVVRNPQERVPLTQLFANYNANCLSAIFGCRTRKRPEKSDALI